MCGATLGRGVVYCGVAATGHWLWLLALLFRRASGFWRLWLLEVLATLALVTLALASLALAALGSVAVVRWLRLLAMRSSRR